MKNRFQRLNKYTKAEIIDGLCHQMQAEHIIDCIVFYLDGKRMKELFRAANAAEAAEAEAQREYADWLEAMAMEYGSENHVNIMDLPLEELKFGAALEKKIAVASERTNSINRKIEANLKSMKADMNDIETEIETKVKNINHKINDIFKS